MTVRAWFTISALVLVALSVAVVARLLAPVSVPAIVVRAGTTRLDGAPVRSCWPDRNGKVACYTAHTTAKGIKNLPRSGRLRIVVAYPVQPKEGSIRVISRSTGRTVLRSKWTSSFSYDLEPGIYVLNVEARYPQRAYLRYEFGFAVH